MLLRYIINEIGIVDSSIEKSVKVAYDAIMEVIDEK